MSLKVRIFKSLSHEIFKNITTITVFPGDSPTVKHLYCYNNEFSLCASLDFVAHFPDMHNESWNLVRFKKIAFQIGSESAKK